MFLGLEGFEDCAPGLLCSASLAVSCSMWAWMFWSEPLPADEASSTPCRCQKWSGCCPIVEGRKESYSQRTVPCFYTMLNCDTGGPFLLCCSHTTPGREEDMRPGGGACLLKNPLSLTACDFDHWPFSLYNAGHVTSSQRLEGLLGSPVSLPTFKNVQFQHNFSFQKVRGRL